jgi:ferritin-like protein
MEDKLLLKLENKTMSKEELFQMVKKDSSLISTVIDGVSSPKAAIRYGCAKVLMDLSKEYPEKLYPHMNFFVKMLDSKYRILTWNAMAIVANLAKVDVEKKFDAVFERYYDFLNDEYMVTVANVVGCSGRIALAKPYLVDRITNELLKVENISLSPHLTEECKRVITEQAIESFDLFFDKISQKQDVISFVERHLSSTRKTLKIEAEDFLKKWK